MAGYCQRMTMSLEQFIKTDYGRVTLQYYNTMLGSGTIAAVFSTLSPPSIRSQSTTMLYLMPDLLSTQYALSTVAVFQLCFRHSPDPADRAQHSALHLSYS
jgi:hypothetical protein